MYNEGLLRVRNAYAICEIKSKRNKQKMAYRETETSGNKRDITRPYKCRKISKNTGPTKQ